MNRKDKVKKSCSNYKEGMCLIRDTECPLVSGFTYRGYEVPDEEIQCDYFNSFVDPQQEATAITKTVYSKKVCAICENHFKPKSSVSKYCSDYCKRIAKRRTNSRYYMNKK